MSTQISISSGSGAVGIHAMLKPSSGNVVSYQLTQTGLSAAAQSANRMLLAPFIPATNFVSSNYIIRVSTAVAATLSKIIVYSDLNGKPDTLIYQSPDIDCSTTGNKTVNTTFNFVAGTTYWIGVWSNGTQSLFTIAPSLMLSIRNQGVIPNPSNGVSVILTYGSAPTTLTGFGETAINMPFVGITQQ